MDPTVLGRGISGIVHKGFSQGPYIDDVPDCEKGPFIKFRPTPIYFKLSPQNEGPSIFSIPGLYEEVDSSCRSFWEGVKILKISA